MVEKIAVTLGRAQVVRHYFRLRANAGFYYVIERTEDGGIARRRSFSDRVTGEKEFYEAIGRCYING